MSISQPNKKKGSKRNKDLVVPVVAVVTDQGHYGFDTCGACGKTLVSRYVCCPFCGAKFEGIKLSPPMGGSDF